MVGAGAMGSGIAQVAAVAGHQVLLLDAVDGAAVRAHAAVAQRLTRRAEAGKMDASDAAAAAARIKPVAAVDDLAPARLVIEAVVEDLGAKQALFADLERVIAADAVLASNTSSLDLSTIASGLQHPERVVGMHFFNPAPALPLVEIASGEATASDIAAIAAATATAWGKTPVHCSSTPGFIVNRCARPFYAEAWLLLDEGADPKAVDEVMRRCGGFRMGPFELMDLIGHDVSSAVSASVFEAFEGDVRFAPSPRQSDLVAAGRLGRKSGRGVYDWEPEEDRTARLAGPQSPPQRVVAHGDLGPLEDLVAHATAAGMEVERDEGSGTLSLDGVAVALSDGRPAGDRDDVAGLIDLALDYDTAEVVAVTGRPEAVSAAAGWVQAMGKEAIEIGDHPGMFVMRTVSMLTAFALDAVDQGVADSASVDTAMKLGVNYPLGPIEWGRRIGFARVQAALEHLHGTSNGGRYRPGPLLRRWAAATG